MGSSSGDAHLLPMDAEPSVSSDTDLPPSSCGNLFGGTVKGWRSVLLNNRKETDDTEMTKSIVLPLNPMKKPFYPRFPPGVDTILRKVDDIEMTDVCALDRN